MSEEASLDEFVNGEVNAKRQEIDQHLPEIDRVPHDWRMVAVEDVAEDLIGGGTPSKSNENYWDGNIPWASVKDLNGIELDETEDYITEAGVGNSATNLVPSHSIIVSTRMTVGEPFINQVEMAINQDMKAIIPDCEKVNPLFLVYSLWDKDPYLKSLGRGTTVDGITTKDLSLTNLGLPLPEEQRKIATVLYTVDQAIQKTERIINQLETVRRGTEQDLLSRGVLENGNLRGEDKIEYKNSWVGEVPTDWVVQPYSELISDSSVGIVVKPSQYYDDSGKVPILRSKDISRDGIVHGDFEYMTQESNNENESSQLQTGDVIAVRSGEPGLSCVVSPEFDGANCADLLISTPGPNLDSDYAAMWINSRAGRKQIDRFQAGLAQKHFNLGALRKLRVAVPEIEEQQRIVERVSSITESLDREKRYKTRLQGLKQGLMQDLLSGTVRTHETDIDVPEAVLAHG